MSYTKQENLIHYLEFVVQFHMGVSDVLYAQFVAILDEWSDTRRYSSVLRFLF
jgi:hypothetical protein